MLVKLVGNLSTWADDCLLLSCNLLVVLSLVRAAELHIQKLLPAVFLVWRVGKQASTS